MNLVKQECSAILATIKWQELMMVQPAGTVANAHKCQPSDRKYLSPWISDSCKFINCIAPLFSILLGKSLNVLVNFSRSQARIHFSWEACWNVLFIEITQWNEALFIPRVHESLWLRLINRRAQLKFPIPNKLLPHIVASSSNTLSISDNWLVDSISSTIFK